MRGSFIVYYLDDLEEGGDYLNISSNGVLLNRIYRTSEKLYTMPIYVGDVITVEYVPFSGFTSEFDLTRKDYTTDDVAGDRGIKTTSIVADQPLTIYSFTATTVSDAYDFEYIFVNSVQSDFQIWTEASEPIMTENDEYINQQY